ncbi:hypothetical protein EVAR_96336_1 [Eumeta japonica]|uniref:Uncharacterized protein n=1 Tax=Eumeta variegata TaxID=151549 RepID=A0A4C1VYR2_EUMVA|nr:hypothetical protein EVAR_96336_1 [Eumeta japonica]
MTSHALGFVRELSVCLRRELRNEVRASKNYDDIVRQGRSSYRICSSACVDLQVIDKISCAEKGKTREIITSQQNVSLIPALYFDGRKDQTSTISEKDGKRYRRRILEEHISLIKEPDSKFLGYITPASGTAKCIEQEIFNFFMNKDISMDDLNAIDVGQHQQLSAEDISTDQKYLYKIVEAVSTGTFPNDLANKSPGKMSHARWLTRANRILRLYASVETPSENLITLATYIVRVYAPVWFAIKTHPSCKDGPRHLFKLIELTRYLPTTLKNIVDPVIQRNAYFAHPENLLLAMLTDFQPHIRELAARRILKARSAKPKRLRLFQLLPEVNFNASTYYDILDWQENITEPPILKSKKICDYLLHKKEKAN